MKKKFNSFEQLGELLTIKEVEQEKELQIIESERNNKLKMIVKNNLKWLRHGKKNSLITKTDDANLFIEKYDNLMQSDKQQKWVLHLITNFQPLNIVNPAPIMRGGNKSEWFCPITNYPITDSQSIINGRGDSRSKHIAYIGKDSNVYLSATAIYSLYLFIVDALENEKQHFRRINSHIDIMRLIEKKSKLNLTNQ